MAVPQKKRGFRKIVVNGQAFNWRLKTQIEVRPVGCRDNRLEVDFGFYDIWLYFGHMWDAPPAFEPAVVTPAFVSSAIQFALANNWDTLQKTSVTKLSYKNHQFSLA
jgi:hypothetical protein